MRLVSVIVYHSTHRSTAHRLILLVDQYWSLGEIWCIKNKTFQISIFGKRQITPYND